MNPYIFLLWMLALIWFVIRREIEAEKKPALGGQNSLRRQA
jgi:hypothetical protein